MWHGEWLVGHNGHACKSCGLWGLFFIYLSISWLVASHWSLLLHQKQPCNLYMPICMLLAHVLIVINLSYIYIIIHNWLLFATHYASSSYLRTVYNLRIHAQWQASILHYIDNSIIAYKLIIRWTTFLKSGLLFPPSHEVVYIWYGMKHGN